VICARCKKDKEPCLFAPWQITHKEEGKAYCRICCSEMQGYSNHMDMRKSKQNFVLRNKRMDDKSIRVHSARKAIRSQEMQELIEKRKQRLVQSRTSEFKRPDTQ
jgi:hypothetical protein